MPNSPLHEHQPGGGLQSFLFLRSQSPPSAAVRDDEPESSPLIEDVTKHVDDEDDDEDHDDDDAGDGVRLQRLETL